MSLLRSSMVLSPEHPWTVHGLMHSDKRATREHPWGWGHDNVHGLMYSESMVSCVLSTKHTVPNHDTVHGFRNGWFLIHSWFLIQPFWSPIQSFWLPNLPPTLISEHTCLLPIVALSASRACLWKCLCRTKPTAT